VPQPAVHIEVADVSKETEVAAHIITPDVPQSAVLIDSASKVGDVEEQQHEPVDTLSGLLCMIFCYQRAFLLTVGTMRLMLLQWNFFPRISGIQSFQ
jgi:hypothetical protein